MDRPELADVVELTKFIMNEYFKGNPQPWFDHLSSRSVFISTGEEMLFGAENIKKHMRLYGEHGAGEKLRDEYIPIPINRKAAIVIAQVISGRSPDDTLRVSCLYTFVYQLIGRETKLIYEHSSYEYFQEESLSSSTTPIAMDLNTLQFVKQILMDSPRVERLCLSTGGKTIFLDTNTVIYIQGDGHGTEIYCIDRVISSSKKIRELLEELSDDFYQIHRSYIINTRYLTALSCYEAEMISGVKIPIPAVTYGQVKKDLEEKLGRPLRRKKK